MCVIASESVLSDCLPSNVYLYMPSDSVVVEDYGEERSEEDSAGDQGTEAEAQDGGAG